MDVAVPIGPPVLEVTTEEDMQYHTVVPPLYADTTIHPVYTPPSLHSVASAGSECSAYESKSGAVLKSHTKLSISRSLVSEAAEVSDYLDPACPQGVSFSVDDEGVDLRKTKSLRRKRRKRAWEKKAQSMDYLVGDVPPWYLCILLAVQHLIVMFGATMAMPIALAPHLCLGPNDTGVVSDLIGTMFFCSGLSTILQSTVGVRLPIVQGGAISFIAPSISLLNMDHWNCSSISYNATMNDVNSALPAHSNTTDGGWEARILELQGGIIVASLVQCVIGFTGVTGFILRYLGPLAIAPTVALVGLSLFDIAVLYAGTQWWITLSTVVLIAGFSQYTKNLNVPCFEFKKGHGCQKMPFPLFRLFPVLLAVSAAWILHLGLVNTGVLPLTAEPVEIIGNIHSADWFRFPYPFQWGWPVVTVAGVFGMLAAVLSSLAQSIGDYYACARISYSVPPPVHAVNRGIGVGGVCMFLSGIWGTGTGTTSFSENIGAIGISKVASRRVIQFAGGGMLLLGVFGKLSLPFALIPDPVIGGVFIVMFGMVTAIGLSNLQFVDLNSTRNLFILGVALLVGMTLPPFVSTHPEIIRSGNEVVNQVAFILFRTNMFMGGLVAFILDNTIPGSDETRGLTKWREYTLVNDRQLKLDEVNDIPTRSEDIYNLPWDLRCLRTSKLARYMPFLPSFREDLCKIRRGKTTSRNK